MMEIRSIERDMNCGAQTVDDMPSRPGCSTVKCTIDEPVRSQHSNACLLPRSLIVYKGRQLAS
jgi:hypothetical protein